MKVLYVAPEYPNRGLNAAQIRANAVLKRLQDQVQLRVLAYPPHGELLEPTRHPDVCQVARRHMTSAQMLLGTFSMSPRAMRRFDTNSARNAFRDELRSFAPDIVHFDTIAVLGLLDVALTSTPRPRIVAQTHDAVSRLYGTQVRTGSWSGRLNRLWEQTKIRDFEKKRLSLADLVLVDSQEDATYLRIYLT